MRRNAGQTIAFALRGHVHAGPAACAPSPAAASGALPAHFIGGGSARLQSSATSPATAVSRALPPNPYASQVEYSVKYATSRRNPLSHTFAHAGKYFDVGDAAALGRVFSNGLAGDLGEEFATTHSNSLLIRPTGVALVHAMEQWRRDSGRRLATDGARVLDVVESGGGPSPGTLGGAAVAGSGGAPASAVSAAAGGSAGLFPLGETPSARSTLHTNKFSSAAVAAAPPFVTSSGGVRVPVQLSPSDIPLQHTFAMLTGPPGVGKSGILNYAVLYARTNGWIVMFVPDSFDVLYNSLVLVRSRNRPGFVDQHDKALAILREVFASHGGESSDAAAATTTASAGATPTAAAASGGSSVAGPAANFNVGGTGPGLLSAVPQRGTYAAFKYLPREMDERVTAARDKARALEDAERAKLKSEASARGQSWDPAAYKSKVDDESDTRVDRSSFTLRDMVQWGLRHPAAATDTLLDLLSELKRVTEVPVLVAVDGLNLMYEHTDYPLEGSGRTLAAEELSVMSAFQCLGETGLKDNFKFARGLFLSTVTTRHGNRLRMFDVADVKHAYRVRVPELTRQELFSTLLHYHKSEQFFMLHDRSAVDAFAVEYYRTLCSGLPREVFKAAMFTPSATGRPPSTGKDKRSKLK